MGMIAPLDSAFLIQEAREHPMHVAGLQIFKTPPGEDEDYPGELYRELLTYTEVSSLFSRRPRDPVESVGCRLAMPKLQRLLDYLEDSLHELE